VTDEEWWRSLNVNLMSAVRTTRAALPVVLLLASDRAGNVTGSDFVIDGGLIKTL
jgi:NAD(P)-dependent dehydrogenase (short-subunit alcohol dehydrogenase family)